MDLVHAVPMVVALVLTRPRWLVVNAILFLVIMLVRGGWSGIYTSIPNLVAYWALAGGMILMHLQETFSDVVKTDKTGLSKTAHTRWMISAFANFLPGSTIFRLA